MAADEDSIPGAQVLRFYSEARVVLLCSADSETPGEEPEG